MKCMVNMLLALSLWFSAEAVLNAQNVVYNRRLPDVGMVKHTNQGPVITMNPRYQQKLGRDVYNFFYKHEVGHVRLNHLYRINMNVRQKEAEADCFAAKNSTRAENMAAYQYFRSGKGGSLRHGTANERAQRVLRCSR